MLGLGDREAEAVELLGEHLALHDLLEYRVAELDEVALAHLSHGVGRVHEEHLHHPRPNVEFTGRDLDAVEDAVAKLERDAPGLLTYTPGGGLSVVDAAPDPEAPVTRTIATGDGWRYEEQLMALKRVAIFGAGHCGLALSRQMSWLGYVVTVLDDRADVPTLGQNTFARHKVTAPTFEELAARVSHPELTSAVVMTADMPSDTSALDGVLRQPFPFVGVMGAPAKLHAICARLLDRGFDEDAIARVRGPVGLEIGSSTPPEIAVSVAAQLVGLHTELFPGAAVWPADAEAPV